MTRVFAKKGRKLDTLLESDLGCPPAERHAGRVDEESEFNITDGFVACTRPDPLGSDKTGATTHFCRDLGFSNVSGHNQ